jgi:hypothetical protein
VPTTNVIVRWDPRRLNANLLSAYGQSIADARLVAIASSPAPRKAGARIVRTGPTSARLGTTGLGHIFELGRKGGYVIQPGLKTVRRRVQGGSRFQREAAGVRGGSGKIALRFTRGDGGFARGGVIGGPQRATPYINPTAGTWARILYQRRARAAIRSFALGR